jgi:hypothetical protein
MMMMSHQSQYQSPPLPMMMTARAASRWRLEGKKNTARRLFPTRHKKKKKKKTSPLRRVRVAAKPFTRPHAFRRDAPLTRPPSSRSPPRSPAAECGEAEEAQAAKRARKLAEGFEEEEEKWALDVDVDGA